MQSGSYDGIKFTQTYAHSHTADTKLAQGDRQSEASNTSLSVVRIGPDDGIVVESSFQGGVKREVLRSLCQVANETRIELEVALAHGEEQEEDAPSTNSQVCWPFNHSLTLQPFFAAVLYTL